ncbi:MAG TPA: glycosyltransferase [Gammaproteobacteria bacterium]|nr:glycosyltransferase [Gammaproteobacteria bacterium]
MQQLFWNLEKGLNDLIEVGSGHIHVVSGYCFHTAVAINRLTIVIDEDEQEIGWFNEPRDDVFHAHMGLDDSGHSRLSGFWGTVKLGPDLIGRTCTVLLWAYLADGQRKEIYLGDTRFVETIEVDTDCDIPVIASDRKDSVAICMATYKPDISAFIRQIQSIIKQSHKNWICIINDDASPPELYRQMLEICSEDKRFRLHQNRENTGFCKNFEQCLRRVPVGINFIALSDQDDQWYEDKLELSLSKIGESALVYSDMRIVSEDGVVQADTYWQGRRNNFTDLDALLIANTVTGAASLFKYSLLKHILPFPERIGDSYHDHWIACVALLNGGMTYIDKPLYDYIQYGNNVIGHCDFDARSIGKKLTSIFKWTGIVGRAIRKKIMGTSESGKFKRDVLMLRDRLLAIYNNEYRRLQLTSELLLLRGNHTSPKHDKALKLFNGRPVSILRLSVAHLSIWLRRHTTNDAEVRLLASCLVYHCNWLLMGLLMNVLQKKVNARKQIDAQNNIHRVEFLENKMAPLKLRVTNETPERVNIIVPELRFDALFGGYIGKFNLAKRFYQSGCQVRIIIVDECEYDPDRWCAEIQRYAGLEGLFDQVEFIYSYDRTIPVTVNSNDIMVATTWWTAYIAHNAVEEMGAQKFLYLIQEFEPFTFPMGTYHALAEHSYALPHNALFSTELLEGYFKEHRYGVYSVDGEAGKRHSRHFSNAVLSFDVDKKKISNRKPRKLMFYARSDAHAARNMYEVGMIALKRCIEDGIFDNQEWEFWAMGTTYGEAVLAKDYKIRMIGKLALHTYQAILPDFDIGLSLMDTPHPSLVPIEMAAAGMVVVTSECMNKDKDSLRKISDNIISGQPTISGIKEAIMLAVSRVSDYDRRILSSRVNWPTSWDDTFSDELMRDILGWYGPSWIDTVQTDKISKLDMVGHDILGVKENFN